MFKCCADSATLLTSPVYLLPSLNFSMFSPFYRSLAATPQVEGSPAGAGGSATANAARNTFEENQRVVRSHLTRGDFDAAFQTALNANR